jgi:hypothetical protein
MKKEHIKFFAFAAGAFGIVLLGNIAAQSIYARTDVKTDKKALTISVVGGLASAGLITWALGNK